MIPKNCKLATVTPEQFAPVEREIVLMLMRSGFLLPHNASVVGLHVEGGAVKLKLSHHSFAETAEGDRYPSLDTSNSK